MTIIVAKKYGKKIIMCCDSQKTCGWNKIEKEASKILEKDNFLIGCAGYSSTSSLLSIFLETRDLNTCFEEKDILNLLVAFDEWSRKRDSSFKLDGQFLVCGNSKIFACNNFGVEEASNYYAIGSGMFLALGALSCNASPKKAVETACKFDLYCSGDIKTFEI